MVYYLLTMDVSVPDGSVADPLVNWATLRLVVELRHRVGQFYVFSYLDARGHLVAVLGLLGAPLLVHGLALLVLDFSKM